MNSDEPPSQPHIAAVILAAGLSTRRRSRTPKERQPLAGRRLIGYVLRAVRRTHPAQIIIVLSPTKAKMAESLPESCLAPASTATRGSATTPRVSTPCAEPGTRVGHFGYIGDAGAGGRVIALGRISTGTRSVFTRDVAPDEPVVGIPAGPVSKRMRGARAGSENES